MWHFWHKLWFILVDSYDSVLDIDDRQYLLGDVVGIELTASMITALQQFLPGCQPPCIQFNRPVTRHLTADSLRMSRLYACCLPRILRRV